MASSSSSSPDVAHVVHPPPEQLSFKYASQDDVLEDLSSRFILNLPEEELASVERICFQVEQAHWYYEDFIREVNPKFPSLPLKKFSAMLFHSCPLLKQWSHDHEQAFNTFMQYKTRVPVCGAIMLNDTWDKCVLVKGWKSSSGWGFPKGKINQDEEPHRCAIREVLEETGYDLSKQINPDDCVEMSIKEQKISLYIVPGVPEDFPFQTRTRKEISKIEWFSLADLPTWKRNKQVSGKFYLISPFVPPLKEFIRVNKPSKRRQQRKPTNGAASSADPHTASQANGVHNTKQAHKPSRGDRNTDGSSSQSSVDHAAPQTPSPELQEACAVVLETQEGAEPEQTGGMDPHFARLLQGLSLSAAKLTTATSTEAVAGDNRLEIKTKEPTVETPGPMLPTPVSLGGQSANAQSPTTSDSQKGVSGISNGATKASTPVASPPTGQPPQQQERVMKHLALLESLASESAQMTPMKGLHPGNPISHIAYGRGAPTALHPGPSSSVPPILHNVPPLPPMRGNQVPNGSPYHPAPHTSAVVPPSVPLPPMLNVDPLVSQMRARPMTSNGMHISIPAPLPNNTPVNRPTRHGANLSMHQGNLLNILGNEKSQPNIPLSPRQVQFANGALGPMTRPAMPHPHPHPHPHHMSPLIPRAVRAPPTMPIMGVIPNAQIPPPMKTPRQAVPHAPNGFVPPNSATDRMHLLSLLKPNSHPLPTPHTVPNYTADQARHN